MKELYLLVSTDYFAGRNVQLIEVTPQNLSAERIERILISNITRDKNFKNNCLDHNELRPEIKRVSKKLIKTINKDYDDIHVSGESVQMTLTSNCNTIRQITNTHIEDYLVYMVDKALPQDKLKNTTEIFLKYVERQFNRCNLRTIYKEVYNCLIPTLEYEGLVDTEKVDFSKPAKRNLSDMFDFLKSVEYLTSDWCNDVLELIPAEMGEIDR